MLTFKMGERTRFQYPKENRVGSEIEWVWREIETTGIRRLSKKPLSCKAVTDRPHLKRGEILIYGKDKHDNDTPKKFYLSAMRGFEATVSLQLVAVDWSHPDDSPEPLSDCFALEPGELGILNETLLLLRKSLKLRPNFSLRIMPVEVPHE